MTNLQPDPNPNAQWEMGQWSPVLSGRSRPESVWPASSGIKPLEPKNKLVGLITDVLLGGQKILESIPHVSGEGSPLAGLGYLTELLGAAGTVRTADKLNYGMNAGMPTMTKPMSSDMTDTLFGPAIPLAAGAARMAAPAIKVAGASRGELGMFLLANGPRQSAAKRAFIEDELNGVPAEKLWQKHGLVRWPDGVFYEIPDHDVAYRAIEASANKRPNKVKNIQTLNQAIEVKEMLDRGVTPDNVRRTFRVHGRPLSDDSLKLAEKNEAQELEDALKNAEEAFRAPIEGLPINQVLPHQRLFDELPATENFTAEFRSPEKMKGSEGKFDTEKGNAILRNTLIDDSAHGKSVFLHEGQHGADNLKGVSYGTSPEWVKRDLERAGIRGVDDSVIKEIYMRNVGEARARLTADRMQLDEAERKKFFPMEHGGMFGVDRPLDSLWMHQPGQHPPMPSAIPLGEALKGETHTLKTLERLPMRLGEIPVQTIREQMARPDVSKAEKDVLESVIQGRQSIPAEDLVSSAKAATKDFQLRPKDSEQWADYGLHHISRPALGGRNTKGEYMNTRTTQWELPQGVVSGKDNHFNNPNYFAHTRAFEEGGIPHVVEIQSDLAQKAGKTLSAERRAELEGHLAGNEHQLDVSGSFNSFAQGSPEERMLAYARTVDELEKINPDIKLKIETNLNNFIEPNNWTYESAMELASKPERSGAGPSDKFMRQSLFRALNAYRAEVQVLIAEQKAKLQAGNSTASIQPMLKNWDRRLVNEELSRAAREREGLPKKVQQAEIDLQEAQNGLAESRQLYGDLAGETSQEIRVAQQRLDELKSKLAVPPVVRFATADTVAKVEGWPRPRHNQYLELEADIHELDALLKVRKQDLQTVKERGFTDAHTHHVEEDVKNIEKRRADKAAELSKTPNKDDYHENQVIYDRYAKDITKYLKSLGGVEVKDRHGHTWLEVPVKSGRTPLFSMSGAASLAAPAASGYNAQSPED